jgi:hypothetical protein
MKTPFPQLLDGIRAAQAQGIITSIKHHYNTYLDRHHLSFEVRDHMPEHMIEKLAVYLREGCEDVIGAYVSSTVVDIWHRR